MSFNALNASLERLTFTAPVVITPKLEPGLKVEFDDGRIVYYISVNPDSLSVTVFGTVKDRITFVLKSFDYSLDYRPGCVKFATKEEAVINTLQDILTFATCADSDGSESITGFPDLDALFKASEFQLEDLYCALQEISDETQV